MTVLLPQGWKVFWLGARFFALVALILVSAVLAHAQEEGSDASPSLVPVGGIILFYNTQGPLSYVTDTHRDVPKDATILDEVKARDCQYALSIPTALSFRATNVSGGAGNGGYKKALLQISKDHRDIKGIFDVKVDEQRLSILSIFTRLCTEISARAFK